MVQLPVSALRRRASPSSSVLWGDCRSCSKMQAVGCTQNAAILVEELSLDHESDVPRQHIRSLNDAYEVEKVLGSGGFGIVQKATLRSGGPASAVKTIAKTSRLTEGMANTEINILQALDHLRICKLLDVCEDPEHIHLVLEYVPGHELFEEISPDRPMKESRAACIMRQVFEALQYCHQLEPAIIHRDVKPENIMVIDVENTDAPEVKLIDWGLAAACHDTIQTPLVGTVCYMSPEALSVGIYSRASDMWSAGAVLYMLLTGGDVPPQFKPLGSSNGSQARPLHELGTSKAAQDILDSLLKRLPEQRLTATLAVNHQWTMATHLSPVQISRADQDDNANSYCLKGGAPTELDSTGDCIKLEKTTSASASLDQLSWTGVDVTNCSSADFAVFDDFEQADQSPNASSTKSTNCSSADFAVFDDFEQTDPSHNGKAKQHQGQRNNGIRNEIHSGVLQGATTTSKPRRSRCQLITCCTPCKENLGPVAPRVCKQLPSPASPLKGMGAFIDYGKKDPLRTRPMR